MESGQDDGAKPMTAETAKEQNQIIRAAKNGDIEAVRTLLAANPALIHARDSDGSTPLHCAAWKGHPEIATVLLDAGADINARNQNDHWGNTPLHAASHGNRRAVAEILVARGADMTARNPSGRTPLAETQLHDAKAVANFLRKHGATE